MAESPAVQAVPISDKLWEYFLCFNPREYVQHISDELFTRNRFFVDERFHVLLDRYALDPLWCEYSRELVHPGAVFFRARKYKEPDKEERLHYCNYSTDFWGYDASNSFVPSIDVAVTQGRLNPDHIRYLYVSSDIQTCLLEVGSQYGDYINIATIKLLHPACLVDLSKTSIWIREDTQEKTDWMHNFVFSMTDAFRKPFSSNSDYLFCQYVSEYYKRVGFDGVMFRTAKAAFPSDSYGLNYTFFNYEKCVPTSSRIYFVNNVIVETKPQTPRLKFQRRTVVSENSSIPVIDIAFGL